MATFGSGFVSASQILDNSITNAKMADDAVLNAEVAAAAAIAYSKLAALTSANLLVGSATNVPTVTAVTGDVTIGNTGVTAIAADVIVNADVNSAAAIALSKLASAVDYIKASGTITVQASTTAKDVDFADIAFSASELAAADMLHILVVTDYGAGASNFNIDVTFDLDATTSLPSLNITTATGGQELGWIDIKMAQSTRLNSDVRVFGSRSREDLIGTNPVIINSNMVTGDAAIFTTAFTLRISGLFTSAENAAGSVRYQVRVLKT